MTVRSPLVLVGGKIEELPASDVILGAPAGPTGSTGQAGVAATLSVGTVTTGAAGSSASVTNSGTSTAAVFNFTIPRGDTGATGPAGANGVMAQIAQVVTSGSQATITFSSIPGTYTNLRLVLHGRDTKTTSGDLNISLQMNGDTTTANYTNTAQIGGAAGSSISNQPSASSSGGVIGFFPGTSGVATATGSVDIIIPSYAGTTFTKMAMGNTFERYNATTGLNVALRAFAWLSTAAITSLKLTPGGTAFVDGTTATLYGF